MDQLTSYNRLRFGFVILIVLVSILSFVTTPTTSSIGERGVSNPSRLCADRYGSSSSSCASLVSSGVGYGNLFCTSSMVKARACKEGCDYEDGFEKEVRTRGAEGMRVG